MVSIGFGLTLGSLTSYGFLTTLVDVRNIISDDDQLQEGVLPALREYNLTQFTTAEVPGHQHQVSLQLHTSHVAQRVYHACIFVMSLSSMINRPRSQSSVKQPG